MNIIEQTASTEKRCLLKLKNSGGLDVLSALVEQKKKEGDPSAMVSPAIVGVNYGVMYLATWDWKRIYPWGGITEAWDFKGVGVMVDSDEGVDVRLTFPVGRRPLTTHIPKPEEGELIRAF